MRIFLFFFFFPKLEKNLFEEVLVNITNPEMMMCVYIYISFSREHSTSDPHGKLVLFLFIYYCIYSGVSRVMNTVLILLWRAIVKSKCIFKSNISLIVHVKVRQVKLGVLFLLLLFCKSSIYI